MAIQEIGVRHKRFLAQSGDEKPTTGNGLGAKLTDVDTGQKWIWYNGAWIEDLELIYAIGRGTEV